MTVGDPGTSREAWRGKQVAVLGMARSGRAVAGLLARHGAVVRGLDLRSASDLGLDRARFAAEGIELRLGEHDPPADLAGIEVVVVSPGIPPGAPIRREAARLGIPQLSELEAASRFALAPMAAVTGTNGKSTTVTVLGQLLSALGRPVAVAGNVGRALSEAVEEIPPHGFLVVEVSSFQLEDVVGFHPAAAALLNLTPDHLDRYESFEAYARTKERLFETQTARDTAVLPEGSRYDALAARHPGRVLRFGLGDRIARGVAVREGELRWIREAEEVPLLGVNDLPLPGPHNQANVAAALALVEGLDLAPDDPRILAALRTLTGLPHRLEPVGRVGEVAFYNDSKATNPDSLAVALRSFPRPVVLIAGGRAKGGDYGDLVPAIRERVAAVVLLGEAAPLLEQAWEAAGVPFLSAGRSLEEALRMALETARPLGATVLFSPGCASFDMFRDFEDRGDRFRAGVRELGGVR